MAYCSGHSNIRQWYMWTVPRPSLKKEDIVIACEQQETLTKTQCESPIHSVSINALNADFQQLLLPMTLLIFLATATWTGIVASNFFPFFFSIMMSFLFLNMLSLFTHIFFCPFQAEFV